MTLLMGVRHLEEFAEPVVQRLSRESLEDKKVMLEISSYPVAEEVRAGDYSFANFWEDTAKYILSKKGVVICGENEVICNKCHQEMEELAREYRDLRYKSTVILNEWEEKRRKLRSSAYYYDRPLPSITEYPEGKEITKLKEKMKELCDKMDWEVPFKERDPHFAKVVEEKKPDVVILGFYHIPYLIKHCFPDNNCPLVYIPSENTLLLKHSKV